MKISSYGRQGSMGNFAHVFGHEQRLLFLSIILDKNSYHDFLGIMTFYQECCICAIPLKKGRDNMGDFSSIYKFFYQCNSRKKSG